MSSTREHRNAIDDQFIVRDQEALELEQHGDEEAVPDEAPEEPLGHHKYNLRTPPPPGALRDPLGEDAGTREAQYAAEHGPMGDADRRVASLVAASHRENRTDEERRASAEKASQIYQEETGAPLEIDEHGRVVVAEAQE
ncbi:hypothetical protein GGF31_008395 [Allomyces arbusculus]|nr:hypothetical protein GGF31_008395 [Allomyces arbusculus]